ncbi:MAG TPA: methyltransferase domain-containing protein [Fibrobacteria bacterium]|nr:methyltransferase domain-containing protein [Fibrobacteria bacterium]
MLFDIAMKLARKSLGSGLYDRISYNWLGRRRHYERLETYSAIHRHYLEQGLDFRGKTVLEVGAGLQYFTALYMLAGGAAKVILVEPKLTYTRETLLRFLAEFNEGSPKPLRAEDVESQIACYQDLSAIPAEGPGVADLMCSFTVLEHVRDLPGFFSLSARLLKPGGRAYHLVDLSDHTYQVFARFRMLSGLNSARALYHLRYSKRMFDLLNDPKCYMNRALMPDYLRLAAANGFRIVSAVPRPYPGRVRVHPELLGGAAAAAETLNITTLALTLERPAGNAGTTA